MVKHLLIILVCHLIQFCQNDDSTHCELNDGNRGICLPFHECDFAIKNAERGDPPQICAEIPKVCCRIQDYDHLEINVTEAPPPITTTVGPQEPLKTESKSFQKCKEYGKSVYVEIPPLTPSDKPKRVSQCGFDSKTLIIGGEAANPKEFPHMAILGYKFKNITLWSCGGSLISENYVLTAAHCTPLKNEPKWIQLGVTDLNDRNKSGSLQEFEVDAIIRHENYAKNLSKYDDIALIKLHRPAVFTAYVRPACLCTNTSISTNSAIAAGWGVDEKYNKVTDLMKVKLSIIEAGVCNQTYSKNKLKRVLPNGINSLSQICAGDPGKDTCKGDSGGPLQVYRYDVDCMYDLIGITSFGLVCGLSPGVYTLLSHYVPWIENIVWP